MPVILELFYAALFSLTVNEGSQLALWPRQPFIIQRSKDNWMSSFVKLNISVPFVSGFEDSIPAREIKAGSLKGIPVGTRDCCEVVIINAMEQVRNVTSLEI